MNTENLSNENDSPILRIGAVISRFCYSIAEKHNISVEDIVIGIELIHPIPDEGKVKLQAMNLEYQLLDEWIVYNGL